MLLIENLIGPLWVFIGFREVPTVWTFLGGGVLLLTLAGHEVVTGLRGRGSKQVQHAAATAPVGHSARGGNVWTTAEEDPAPGAEPMFTSALADAEQPVAQS